MRTILLILFIFFTLNSFSQQKVWIGDTSYWYSYQKQIAYKLNLSDLSKSKYPFFFRLSSQNTIVDIWSKDGSRFFGSQTFFTCTYNENPKEIKYLSKTIKIYEDTAQLIYRLIGDFGLGELSLQDSIKSWGNGLDGTTYIIEFASRNSYSFKSYWSPQSFPKIPEAATIAIFVSKIDELLMQNQKLDNFINSLPKNKNYRIGNTFTKIKK